MQDAGKEVESCVSVNKATIKGFNLVASILTDQILLRRLYHTPSEELGQVSEGVEIALNVGGCQTRGQLINTPEDAANSLQFNTLLLGPYQSKVLFVLCTLLGGRRKLDAQDLLDQLGIIPV